MAFYAHGNRSKDIRAEIVYVLLILAPAQVHHIIRLSVFGEFF